MSFRQEILDFITAASATSKMFTNAAETQGKNKYYDAIIGLKQQAAEDLNAHRAATRGLASARLGATNAYRNARLGQHERALKLREDESTPSPAFKQFMEGQRRQAVPTPGASSYAADIDEDGVEDED